MAKKPPSKKPAPVATKAPVTKQEICATCKKSIEGEGVSALGKSYHAEHFICVKCKKQITEKFQADKNNDPYCPDCAVKYLGVKVAICAACNKEIEGEARQVNGKIYHPNCFVCTNCKKVLTTKCKFNGDKPYCDDCFAKEFGVPCFKCGQPVIENGVKAAEHIFHIDCFVCYDCNANLTKTPFKEHEGKLICEKCFVENYAPKCKACGKGIVGPSVSAMGGTFHADCFKCIKCGAKIQDDFLISDEGPICKACGLKETKGG